MECQVNVVVTSQGWDLHLFCTMKYGAELMSVFQNSFKLKSVLARTFNYFYTKNKNFMKSFQLHGRGRLRQNDWICDKMTS